MLTSALARPRYSDADSWDWAITHGQWLTIRGHQVLQLGAADYVLDESRTALYSINGDSSNTWNTMPFGIRWAVDTDNIARDSYGTPLDRLAVEQFRRKGLLS